MPGDPFAKVTRGEPLVIQAQAWNAFIDSAVGFVKFKRQFNSGPLTTSRSTTIIRIKNESGNNLTRGQVLGLNGPLFDPGETNDYDALLREVVFRGETPDITKHKRKYAVLLEAAPSEIYGDQPIVTACLSGLCYAKVSVHDEVHEYATIADGDSTQMDSSRFGHAHILWREGESPYGGGYYDSGLQWAILDVGNTASCFSIGKAVGDIPARAGSTYGTGKVGLYRSSTGMYSGASADGPVETIDVLNAAADPNGKILNGKYCAVCWDADDVAFVSPLEC